MRTLNSVKEQIHTQLVGLEVPNKLSYGGIKAFYLIRQQPTFHRLGRTDQLTNLKSPEKRPGQKPSGTKATPTQRHTQSLSEPINPAT